MLQDFQVQPRGEVAAEHSVAVLALFVPKYHPISFILSNTLLLSFLSPIPLAINTGNCLINIGLPRA
jgi:hypothetical protein